MSAPPGSLTLWFCAIPATTAIRQASHRRAGDSIYLKDGNVYVNGRKLQEAYLAPGTPTFTVSKYRDQ